MTSPVFASGKNGLIYISGTELSVANAWSIAINQPAGAYAIFGDKWMRQDVAINDWSGSVAGYHDQDSKQLQTAATAGVAVALLIYPKRTDLTTYYSGSAVFSFSSDGAVGAGPVTGGSNFVGDGELAMTGFAA